MPRYSMLKYCTQCGSKLDEGTKFCGECGANLNSSTSEPLKKREEEESAKLSAIRQGSSISDEEEGQPVRLNVYDLGTHLENTTASIFEKMGYAVQKRQMVPTHTNAAAEIDLLLTRGNRKKAVECKNYDPTRTIGVSLLRIFKNKLEDAGISSGLFVTNSYFSEDAQKFAQSTGMELWDGDELREKFFAYSIGRIRNPSLVRDPILPIQQDFVAASAIPLKNVHSINLFSAVLAYHPYIIIKYRLQSIRKDPTGKRHTIRDENTLIVDALDGDIINGQESTFNTITGGFFKSKEKRLESKEKKIVTDDLLTISPVKEAVMNSSDYSVSVAESEVSEEEAVRLVKVYVVVKNTDDVDYQIKVRGEWETRSLRIVPKANEVSIRGTNVIYVPKWDLQYESGQRSFERKSIASSGRIVYDGLAKCERCSLIKGVPMVVCEYCGDLLCEKHSFEEEGQWVCKDHLSDSRKEQIDSQRLLSKFRKRIGV